MTISFAGVTMLLESPEGHVERFIENFWSLPTNPINTPPRTIDTRSLCQVPNWPEVPRLKLNQLYIPSGATRWSRMLLLTDDEGMDQLYNKSHGELIIGTEYLHTIAGPTSTSSSSSRGAPLRSGPNVSATSSGEWDIGDNYRAVMFKLDPIPVSIKQMRSSSTTGHARGNHLYIIPLVDERYYWQGINLVTTATEWVSPEYPSSSSSAAAGEDFGTSYRGLLGDIATALASGALGAPDYWDYINGKFLPNGNPSYIAFRNGPIPAAAALDLLAWSQNLLLVPDDHRNTTSSTSGPISRYRLIGNGTYFSRSSSSSSSSSWLTPQNLVQGQKNAADWEMGPGHAAGNEKYGAGYRGASGERASIAYDYPAKIRVIFTSPTSLAQPASTYDIDPPSGFGSGQSGLATMHIKCLATADSLSSASPTNSGDLEAIAETWAQNWYRNYVNQFDWSFNNMPILKFTGVEDFIMFDAGWKPGFKDRYSAFTRWVSLPANYGYEYIAIETALHKTDRVTVPTTGSGLCGCCDCFVCLSPGQVTVSTCSAAPTGAAFQYLWAAGNWIAYPGMTPSGFVLLTYQVAANCSSNSISTTSSGGTCKWYSCPTQVCASLSTTNSSSSACDYCGVYQWQMTIDTNSDGYPRAKIVLVKLSCYSAINLAG